MISGRTVKVYDDNVEKALRKFKKKVANSNVLQEVRERQEYIKPSQKRKVALQKAKSRWRKKLSKDQPQRPNHLK